jgi:hypothetical protein
MRRFVNVLSLNVRSSPVFDPSNKIGVVFLGHPVDVVGPGGQPGWVKVRVDLGAGRIEGFVAEKYLRDPVTPSREVLIAAAIKEWNRFERGLGKEHVNPYFRFVGEMWARLGMDLDGRDRDVPWSAAFISFAVRNAGSGYSGFKFAAAHARYVHDAIKRREANDTSAPFWGYRLHERKPQLGDLVCRWREVPVDFDDARHRNDFKSHCDIVLRIDSENDEVLTIGGNVDESVSLTTYKLTAGDFLAGTGGVFALLANRTDA